LLWGRLVNLRPIAIGLLDSAPQAKRIANPLQDTILPHNICENALRLIYLPLSQFLQETQQYQPLLFRENHDGLFHRDCVDPKGPGD
jgi:hypothetical protein